MLLTLTICLFAGFAVGGFLNILMHGRIAIQYTILWAVLGSLIGGLTIYSLSPQVYAWALELALSIFGAIVLSLTANLLPKE